MTVRVCAFKSSVLNRGIDVKVINKLKRKVSSGKNLVSVNGDPHGIFFKIPETPKRYQDPAWWVWREIVFTSN